ncbi:hypothetical protein LNV09_11580 [Paucibacter sp. B2R-40]|uniref:hypothetical protein n=1 Tax=Paucibacter sp. B2R-40 TaxID=2893554 RepID=UPI0021E49F78|nr:hypothetical protein [Paucibacter sp. B2R-40]MCV2354798.1 hypothetical protein [Paucibacter sp. B2R-40]
MQGLLLCVDDEVNALSALRDQLPSSQVNDSAVKRLRAEGKGRSLIAKPWEAGVLLAGIEAGLATFADPQFVLGAR